MVICNNTSDLHPGVTIAYEETGTSGSGSGSGTPEDVIDNPIYESQQDFEKSDRHYRRRTNSSGRGRLTARWTIELQKSDIHRLDIRWSTYRSGEGTRAARLDYIRVYDEADNSVEVTGTINRNSTSLTNNRFSGNWPGIVKIVIQMYATADGSSGGMYSSDVRGDARVYFAFLLAYTGAEKSNFFLQDSGEKKHVLITAPGNTLDRFPLRTFVGGTTRGICIAGIDDTQVINLDGGEKSSMMVQTHEGPHCLVVAGS